MSQNATRSRLRTAHLPLLLLILAPVFIFSTTRTKKPNAPISNYNFCPITLPDAVHVPTVILQGSGNESRDKNRTYWIDRQNGDTFLPYDWPRSDRRRDADGIEIPMKWSNGFEESWGGQMVEETNKKLCNVHQIPSTRPYQLTKEWKNSNVMFGMSTPPQRALHHLLLWSHWLPSSLLPDAQLPLLLVLTPPLSVADTILAVQVETESKEKGMNVITRPIVSDRFETRYLTLVREMWMESIKRQKTTGINTEWFVFADDDTFFPDWASVAQMLSSHDSTKDVLVGALSEAPEQVEEFGKIAFGGAGIFISKALMAKMNRPGAWQRCLDKFGSTFGGDSMVSLCASLSIEASSTLPEVWEILDNLIIMDQTLHQLDIRGDGTGFLQSGFLITSLHHFLSWFTLFPPWHYSGSGDLRNGIMLIGSAAKATGGDNFGRRFVFEAGRVVVHLGYSVVVFTNPITRSQLSKTEHTWNALDSRHPMRDAMPESVDKLTYYLTAVVPLAHEVVRLVHTNRDGGRLDVVFDGRGGSIQSWSY